MEEPIERRYRVGDLVTASRMREHVGRLLVCRLVAIFGVRAFLAPVAKWYELPRSVPLDDLTLIEPWIGPEMLSCKEGGTVEHWPGDFPPVGA